MCYGTPGIDIKCKYIPSLLFFRTSEIIELYISFFLLIYILSINSRLKNIFFPRQACAQSQYIPSSKGDLYNYRVIAKPSRATHSLLFKVENFNAFNPNTCDLGKKLFNNHTRVQTKNFK